MKFSIIFLLSILIICCEKQHEKFPDCQKSYKIAKEDFQKNKFIYYEYQYLTQDTTYNKSFEKLLKENDIAVQFETKYPVGCVVIKDAEEESKKCYQVMMNNQLEAKFGSKFFDSIRLKSKNN
ncbi:MAG: hypothetical protein K0M56_03710 [Kaistella sp.]|nr:hypothetical protein [Kaistella sp.]